VFAATEDPNQSIHTGLPEYFSLARSLSHRYPAESDLPDHVAVMLRGAAVTHLRSLKSLGKIRCNMQHTPTIMTAMSKLITLRDLGYMQ
jgi:hypothetical protein